MFKSRPGHYGVLNTQLDRAWERMQNMKNKVVLLNCAISVNLGNNWLQLIFIKHSFDPDVI